MNIKELEKYLSHYFSRQEEGVGEEKEVELRNHYHNLLEYIKEQEDIKDKKLKEEKELEKRITNNILKKLKQTKKCKRAKTISNLGRS